MRISAEHHTPIDISSAASAIEHFVPAVDEEGMVMHPNDLREHEEFENWTLQDYLQYGAWAAHLKAYATETELPVSLTTRDLSPLAREGFGPQESDIYRVFGTSTNFKRATGALTRRPGEYSDWGLAHYIDHANNLDAGIEGRPTTDDLTERAQHKQGPSLRMVERDLGGFANLLERTGYINIKSWDTNDYITWGAEFALMNDGRTPSSVELDIMSSRGVGPSKRAICNQFEGMSEYRRLVADRIESLRDEKEADLRDAWQVIDSEMRDKRLSMPPRIDDPTTFAARLKLMQQIGVHLLPQQRTQLALADELPFAQGLAQQAGISVQDLEYVALANGLLTEIYGSQHVKNLEIKKDQDQRTLADSVVHAQDVRTELGRKPRAQDFWDREADDPDIVSVRQMYNRFGVTVTGLLEYIGYPKLTDWTADDFDRWAARFERDNQRHYAQRDVAILSKQGKNPSWDKFMAYHQEHGRESSGIDRQNQKIHAEEARARAHLEMAIQRGIIPRINLDCVDDPTGFALRLHILTKFINGSGLRLSTPKERLVAASTNIEGGYFQQLAYLDPGLTKPRDAVQFIIDENLLAILGRVEAEAPLSLRVERSLANRVTS